ncbi:MAG: glycoside hydrolase family 9 protein [Planctomycetes bacterium]|nr:glycoside hydrolase family 9 protein [Planctomycetota bacterium]
MLKHGQIYQESVEKSLSWMLRQINPDGTINPVGKGAIAYYKIPLALVLGGKSIEAKKVIDWIVKETMESSDGDIKSEKRQKFALDYYTYPNTWVCLASHLLSLFDISYPIWNYIATFQDPETGGYCSRSPFAPDKDNLQDMISSAWSSMVGLHLGKLKEAVKAADFLEMMVKIQPDFPRRLYYYWYPKKGLVTKKPPEEPDERFIRIDTEDKTENFYYIVGAVMAFLAKLYTITKEKKHLQLAETFFDFVKRAPETLYSSESCGKLCYGSTLLYRATRELKYIEAAEKFMLSVIKIGEKDGYWIRGGVPTISSTAEFCLWFYNLLFIGWNGNKQKSII